jgi:hypothetical protein
MHTRQSVYEPASGQDSAGCEEILELTPAPFPEMYPPSYNEAGQLTHSICCQKLFERGDWRCPRCVAIEHGKTARGSWHRRYFRAKLNEVQGRLPL